MADPPGELNASNRRAAVLGRPIEHSLSPVLHRAAYDALGLTSWTYTRHDVGEAELAPFVAGLDTSWAGLSLTMPLKKVALACCDHVEPLAELLGVVNTLLLQPAGNGRLVVGANTDVAGIVASLAEVRDLTARPLRSAVVLGGGATAISALAALGSLGVRRAIVGVRTPARSGDLVRAAHQTGLEPDVRRWGAAARAVPRADVVIQTAPAGASDAVAAALDAHGDRLDPAQVLLDVVYDPFPTPLDAAWERAGGTVAPGWLMLLHQAAEQVRLMTGKVAPVEAMRAALTDALGAG
ncbi:Shikimate dehydrogenase substrate binding domain protein [Beutenbergia cavernae DSM 12333]|uniref:Shikimate dehydrogenase substrate binding domain protein n=1 Tax=Beutenbergia cavernae (strain ATCC BAA-8 / DSM 12333 / CCUG 43141 / JCM 11478 / NBRC 16432 / NCIMB 13614 / HKI 0122) TaxID=471853 RepID=C5C5T1_BEUC1|nr:shikimate dehydrogenase [Beutenbergia cavernae]ACQ80272.1 Shikimate dehydrogenase substrate binding domain protein [Beutenbergia cavernae DSM 12333]